MESDGDILRSGRDEHPNSWPVMAMLWAVAILLATQVDGLIAVLMRDIGAVAFLKDSHRWVAEILKLPGEYPIILLVGIIVAFLHPLKWQAGGFISLCGAVSGMNALIKWAVGRTRPLKGVDPLHLDLFRGGLPGLFYQSNLSFVSGHTALAFAAAESLAILFPRRRGWFYLVASFTAAERVLESAHYLSDAIGGAALGIFGTRLIAWVCRQFIEEREPWKRRLSYTANFMGTSLLRIDDEATRAWGRLHRRRFLGRELSEDDGADQGSASLNMRATTLNHRVLSIHETSRALELSASCAEDSRRMNEALLPYLSLVIPCYNEEENVPLLLQRVGASLQLLGKPYEVLLIDDGSTDSTPRLLEQAMQTYPWLRVLRMAKNGGQSAAFEAGFDAARGEIIATIDADLQNDPEEIPRLVALLEEKQVDMITGWRKERQDTPFRRWQSRQANRLRNWITQETVNDSASSLKLYHARAIKGIKLFKGAHRYFPTLVKMRGYTVHETPVKHSQRHAGAAKYGFGNRAFVGLVDLFGVRWLKKRAIAYQVNEVVRATNESNRSETQVAQAASC